MVAGEGQHLQINPTDFLHLFKRTQRPSMVGKEHHHA